MRQHETCTRYFSNSGEMHTGIASGGTLRHVCWRGSLQTTSDMRKGGEGGGSADPSQATENFSGWDTDLMCGCWTCARRRLVVSRQGTSVQDSETAPQCLEAGRKDREGFQKPLETFQNYLTLSGSFHEFHMNFVHSKTLCFSIHEIHMKFMEASRNFPEFSGRFLRVSGSPP